MKKRNQIISFILAFITVLSTIHFFNVEEAIAAPILVGESSHFIDKGEYGLQKQATQKGLPIPSHSENISSFSVSTKVNIYDSIRGTSAIDTIDVLSQEKMIGIPLDYYVYHPLVKYNGGLYALDGKNNVFSLSNTAQKRYIDLNKLDSNYTFYYYIDIANGKLLDVIVKEADGSNLTEANLNDKNFTNLQPVKQKSKILKDQGNGHTVVFNYYIDLVQGFIMRELDEISVNKDDTTMLNKSLSNVKSSLDNNFKNFKWGDINDKNINWDKDALYIYGQGYQTINKDGRVFDQPIAFVQKINILEDEDLDYKVVYKDEDGNIIESEDHTTTEGESVTHSPKDIPGYTPVNENPITEVIDGPDKEIVFIYKKDKNSIDYKVIYKDEDGNVLESEDYTTTEGESVTHSPKTIEDYTPLNNNDITEVITENGQEIVFIYSKNKANELGYEVIYKDKDGNVIDKDLLKTTEGSEVTHKPKDIPGYTPVSKDPITETITKDGQEIVFIYDKNKAEELDYKVVYKDEDGKVLESEDYKSPKDKEVTHKPKSISGYTPKSQDPKTVKITKDGQEIVFIYSKNKSSGGGGGGSSSRRKNYEYKIEYINDKTNKIIEEDYKTVRDGTEVTHKPKDIKGYVPKNTNSITKTIDRNNIVIKFYYKGDGDTEYKIVYKHGDKVIDQDVKYGDDGEKVTHKPKDIPGYIPVDKNSKSLVLKKKGDNVIYFQYETQLNKEDHYAYIQGYEDNTVRPSNQVTRAEVAEVFYRLLNPSYKKQIRTTSNSFKDVDSGKWYNTSISTLNKADIISGYTDGSFKPNKAITRAELATIAARFDKLERVEAKFKDVKGHWAEKYIGSASNKGWVNGYTDGTFKPNQPITRAEFVTLVNNVLDRNTTVNNMVSGRRVFKDLSSKDQSKWYYEAMQEAINSHDYTKTNGVEKWTSLKSETLID